MQTATLAPRALGLLTLLGGLVAAPVLAGPSMKAMDAACHPGTEPQQPGSDYAGGLWSGGEPLTPVKLPGTVTVSAREAKCLLDTFGKDVVVIAAVDDARRLPNAHPMPWAASAASDYRVQLALMRALEQLTDGDQTRPLLVYCHHIRCFLSYNVALRSTQLGYTSVFWMRPGLSGWAAAGYPLEQEEEEDGEEEDEEAEERPAAEEGLRARYLAELKACDERSLDYEPDKYALHAHQFVSLAESDASWAKDIAKAQEMRQYCLGNVKRSIAGTAAEMADIDARLARSDAEVAEQYRKARAEVEANPAKYFDASVYEPEKLRRQLALARSMKTTAEKCGDFDFSMPPIDNSVIRARDARRKEYGKCLMAWREDSSFALAEIEFSMAATWAAATERFTCAKRKVPNCLPDAAWHSVADVATPENLRIVQRADELYSSRFTEVDELIPRLNTWLHDVNEMVDEYNASN